MTLIDSGTEKVAGGELQKLSAVDRLVGQLRDYMRERDLSIGDALPTERELGELFQAGRNTVREALRVLKAYGIVEIRPKVGATLSARHEDAIRRLFAFQNDISPASFLDVQGFRRIIEVGIGDHIILHASASDLDRLNAFNDDMLNSGSVDAAARADFAFHETLVELSNNRTLLASYRLLQPVITNIMRIGKATRPAQIETHAEHGRIIGALKARDRVAYTYLLSRHLEYGLQFLTSEKTEELHLA